MSTPAPVVEYRIARGKTTEELEETVRQFIHDGFDPFGSMAAVPFNTKDENGKFKSRFAFLQPMVRYEPETE